MIIDISFWLDWLQALLVMVVPLSVSAWAVVTTLKPFLSKIGDLLPEDWRYKVMTAIYMLIAGLIGFGISAYLKLAVLEQFGAPAWAGHLVVAFLISLGENILHQVVAILVAIKDWLRGLPYQ